MLYLASNSPRRRELLAGLDIEFEVKVLPGIDESYPATLPAADVPQFLAQKKAQGHRSILSDDTSIVITADTVVICDGSVLGKPRDAHEARQMLRMLSGKTHEVITGVCLMSTTKQKAFSVSTTVEFAPLSDDEIDYYIERYRPYDKAGSYGIQEWIGYVGVRGISGSFYNVMGLPIQRLYEERKNF